MGNEVFPKQYPGPASLPITVTEVDYHRNGINGEPFFVVLFTWVSNHAGRVRNMAAFVFEEKLATAVIDRDLLAEGKIGMVHDNQWRGDAFDGSLRDAIRDAGWTL